MVEIDVNYINKNYVNKGKIVKVMSMRGEVYGVVRGI